LAFFTIVGTGTGTEQYLVPHAKSVIENADILIGGERNLTPWLKKKEKTCYVIKTPLIETVNIIRSHYEQKSVVVLVSGDPGFYSILNFLNKHFPKEELIVIPGISSIQIAFARLAIAWQDAILLNLHGRSLEILDNHINETKLALLTDPINNPQTICQYLIEKGRIKGLAHICSRLGYPNEKIITINLNGNEYLELNNLAFPIVVVITDE